jgi:predicted nucleic acid-binding protein
MKAYLDNNVVSAIPRDDLPAESAALDRLLRAYERGEVELATSELTLQEINNCPQQYRRPLERTFRLIMKVPMVRWDELVGMNAQVDAANCLNAPIIENAPMYDALLNLGLSEMDARHVYVAAQTNCNSFLTLDRGILHRATDIHKICGLVIEAPSVLVARTGW